MHLIIDGYGSNSKLLQDEEYIRQLLDSKISAPTVFRYVGSKPEDWGVSGLVFIAESHISIHTFVERCYVNIDIFSCKDFDAEQAIRDFRDAFQLTRFTTRLINRDWNIADLAEVSEVTQLHPV